MSKQWDEGYCPDCGVYLGAEFEDISDHWCPLGAMEDLDELVELSEDEFFDKLDDKYKLPED